jgi:hypothetical protein
MATYDPTQLARHAASLLTRAKYIAFLYTGAAGLLGLPLGAVAAVGISFLRRLQFVRSHADAAELAQTDELVTLFHHAPFGALMTGVALCVVGLLVGRARSTELRVQGQTALCLAQIEANTRR